MDKDKRENIIKKYLEEFTQKRTDPILPLYIGVLYLASNDYKQSVSWFVKSSETDKAFAPAHFFCAMASLCDDSYDVALLEGELFLRYAKNPFEYYRNLDFPFEFNVAKIRSKSISRAKHRKKVLPADINAAYLAGLTYAFWGEDDFALESFESVLETESLPSRFLMVLSELYLKNKRSERALSTLKRLYRQEGDSLGVTLKLAELYLQIKDFSRAVPLLQKAFEMKPARAATLVDLAVAYRGGGKPDVAQEVLTDALCLDDGLVSAWFEFGILCEESFLWDSAIKFFGKALSLESDFGDAYYHIGLIYKRQGHNDLAVPAFYRASRYLKDNASVHYQLAETLMALKEFEEAAIEFLQVIKKDPTDVYAYMNLGRCLTSAGMYDEASYCLNKALSIQKDFIEPHYYLSLNYLIKGNLKAARESLLFFVGQKPQDTYARFTLGNVYMRQGEYESAVREYMEAISLYPDHPYARFNLAASYACAGKYEQAQKEFSQALHQNPPESEEEMIIFAVLGSYQSILQRLAGAVSELNVYFKRYNEAKDRFQVEEKIKNRIADLFKKVLPEKIAEDLILTEKTDEGIEDEQRMVSVLFSDIRGYTDLTERSGATGAMKFLNDYYKLVSKVIEEYSGTLLYFQGDAQMVIFGAPQDDEEHAVHALQAAQAIKAQVAKMSVADGSNVTELSIGVATGEVVMGFINDGMRLQYTAIGDAVNIASRLQALSKEHDCSILIADSTYQSVKDNMAEIRFLDSVKLKGIAEAMNVYKLETAYEA